MGGLLINFVMAEFGPAAYERAPYGPARTCRGTSWRESPLHYMSSTSLLSVVIPLRDRSTATRRFVRALGELLRGLNVRRLH